MCLGGGASSLLDAGGVTLPGKQKRRRAGATSSVSVLLRPPHLLAPAGRSHDPGGPYLERSVFFRLDPPEARPPRRPPRRDAAPDWCTDGEHEEGLAGKRRHVQIDEESAEQVFLSFFFLK